MSGPVIFKRVLAVCSGALAMAAAMADARAADMPAITSVASTVGILNFFQGIEVHGQIEAGALFNGNNPTQGQGGVGYNFGHFYADHAGVPMLNQALLTITKPVDPKATGYAFGFTAQGLYGSDMRSNHFLGIGTFFMGRERAQLNVLQGFGAAHLPWFTPGGTDVKLGLYTSPQGYESLDPSTSPFYSHSYTYNYAVSFNHTGVLSTTHVTDKFDVWLGIDTGNQTTFGRPYGDPNEMPAGFVGFGFNHLLNDRLTILTLSHIGPEQPYGVAYNGVFNAVDNRADRDLRYYNDVVITYKITDTLTSVTELNYLRDDFGASTTVPGVSGTSTAESLSAVQYLAYAYTPTLTFNARGEVFRDRKNTVVYTPTDNSGQAKAEIGLPPAAFTSSTLGGPLGQGTTYVAGTIGVTFKPDVPKPFALFAVRPEIRYDRIVAGAALFGSNDGNGRHEQFLFGGDVILGF